MKNRFLKTAVLLAVASLTLAVSVPRAAGADSEYSFSVENKTKSTITKVLVSQDKKTWSYFDLSSDGIPAGKTVKLVWDKSTNNQQCKQWVKAVYSDGSESDPAQFDFCESKLEIEFD